jgi:hypothetical protein
MQSVVDAIRVATANGHRVACLSSFNVAFVGKSGTSSTDALVEDIPVAILVVFISDHHGCNHAHHQNQCHYLA